MADWLAECLTCGVLDRGLDEYSANSVAEDHAHEPRDLRGRAIKLTEHEPGPGRGEYHTTRARPMTDAEALV